MASEGARRGRSAGARSSRSGERESWQSACRRCAWQGSETKTRNPGKLALAGVRVRKAQAFRSRRKAWSGGDGRLGHAGRDVHGPYCLKWLGRLQAVPPLRRAALRPMLHATAMAPVGVEGGGDDGDLADQ